MSRAIEIESIDSLVSRENGLRKLQWVLKDGKRIKQSKKVVPIKKPT